jgi:ADP-ribose pyrophosphatase YjhB (NUDIX family)
MTKKDPLDRAYKVVGLNFAEMFGDEPAQNLEKQFAGERSFKKLRNTVLQNIIKKLTVDESCGLDQVYRDLNREFGKINSSRNGPLQLPPYFTFSYEIAGSKNAHKGVITDFEGFRLYKLEEKGVNNPCEDTGFLKLIYNYLKNNSEKSVVLQLMIPDGRCVQSLKYPETFVRFSDIQITPFKGKIEKGEMPDEAAAREFAEETGFLVDREKFRVPSNVDETDVGTKSWTGDGHHVFALDVANLQGAQKKCAPWERDGFKSRMSSVDQESVVDQESIASQESVVDQKPNRFRPNFGRYTAAEPEFGEQGKRAGNGRSRRSSLPSDSKSWLSSKGSNSK